MFLTNSKPVGNLIADISPGSLLETILSVHTVPHRFVVHTWTSGTPLPHFFQWRLTDQLGLYVFVAIVIALLLNVRSDRARRDLAGRLLLAFLVFVALESILILRLSPWIVEVNYYAAFSSLFFALIMAALISGLRQPPWVWLSWVLTAYLAVVEFANYWDTAQRHPSIAGARFNWEQLREVHGQVAAGNFADVAKERPFPSQVFSYGFEHAAALEHAAGRRIDLQPMQNPADTVYGFIDLDKLQDPNIIAFFTKRYNENDLRFATGVRVENGGELASRLAGRTIRGMAGDWNFIGHFGRSGEVHERVWWPGLMRVWSRKGTASESNDELCMDFPSHQRQCVARAYEYDGVTYMFSEMGILIGSFRWLPTKVQIPRDLGD
jgi:hypothetical protein